MNRHLRTPFPAAGCPQLPLTSGLSSEDAQQLLTMLDQARASAAKAQAMAQGPQHISQQMTCVMLDAAYAFLRTKGVHPRGDA